MENIRTASFDDLKALTEVESMCFPAAEAASEEDFRKRLEVYPNHFYLLFEDDILVSFVNGMTTDNANLEDEMYSKAEMHNENGCWQMIFGVNTIPSKRRMGYAEKLIKYAIEQAKNEKRKGVVLTCKEPLIHYYAKFGFINEGLSKSTHGNAKWYQMRLTF